MQIVVVKLSKFRDGAVTADSDPQLRHAVPPNVPPDLDLPRNFERNLNSQNRRPRDLDPATSPLPNSHQRTWPRMRFYPQQPCSWSNSERSEAWG